MQDAIAFWEQEMVVMLADPQEQTGVVDNIYWRAMYDVVVELGIMFTQQRGISREQQKAMTLCPTVDGIEAMH